MLRFDSRYFLKVFQPDPGRGLSEQQIPGAEHMVLQLHGGGRAVSGLHMRLPSRVALHGGGKTGSGGKAVREDDASRRNDA